MPAGTPDTRFAPYHRWDRNFYLAFAAACWLGAIIGFYPTVELRFTGRADYPAPIVLQIHAIIFPGWLALLTLQTLLIRARRPALHRLLGLTALGFIPLMVVTGVWSEILSQRFYGPGDPGKQSFFIIPLYYMVAFPILAGAALWFRTAPNVHKRLMLLATAAITGAAYARWWGDAIMSVTGDGFFGTIANTFAGFYLLAGAAMVFDRLTRGRVHPVYLAGLPLMFASHLAVSDIYHSDGWRPIARAIAGI